MLEAVGNVVVSIMDYVLGWTLYLPRDATVLIVAVLTSAIFVCARRFGTDQAWLKRAWADKKRLRQLIRQARRDRDREAKKRYKATLTLIKARVLKFEFKPLLWAIVPVALVGTWCFFRLGFHPPQPGQSFHVRAYLTASAIGGFAHLVPEKGLVAENGWVQRIVPDEPASAEGLWDSFNARVSAILGPSPKYEGVAAWRIRADRPGGEYTLKLRYAGKTYKKDLLVGSRHYAPAVAGFQDAPVYCVELGMRPVKPFGVVEGIDFLYMPGWLVAYLIIAIALVAVFKRLFRVY